ncbi:hypothetical protein [Sphingomonas mucosissima]|uniref:Peptidoglycan binding domain protein n=1 Tax=Sphingomonas mucosissima TaxID=370959 RepID=A0A245ZDP0_9SPHN|nr:hypothetical protein [Sphingomonas mucosissima]OWK27872.1 hypothetical protein SPMU_33050 [Sphingomonas mucosissima]
MMVALEPAGPAADRNRTAAYRSITLPGGGDAQIKAIQDRLVALAYLEGHHADGLVGRSQNATLDAVRPFSAATA